MSILLAMQSVDKREWREKVTAIYSQAAPHDEDSDAESLDAGNDGGADGRLEDEEDEQDNDEIGDILAATQAVGNGDLSTHNRNEEAKGTEDDALELIPHEENGNTAWWEVGESESHLSSSSFREVGSARTSSSSSSRTPQQRRSHQVRASLLAADGCYRLLDHGRD